MNMDAYNTVNADDLERYKVEFWGDVLPENSRTEVAAKFAKLFRIQQPDRLKQLFSGRVVTLKGGLTKRKAKHYCVAIRRIGGICRLQREELGFTSASIDSEYQPPRYSHFIAAPSDYDSISLVPKDKQREQWVAASNDAALSTVTKDPFAAREVSGPKYGFNSPR